MSDIVQPTAAPAWPRLVAAFGLIWNSYGIYKFLGVLELARAGAIPIWVLAGFALSVFAGTIGSLCLLLLNRWATPLLVVALLGDAAWAWESLSGGDPRSMLVIASLLIALLLAATAWSAGRKGWLR